MQYRYATKIGNTDMQYRYAINICNTDMQYRYAIQICNTDMRYRYAIKICNKELQQCCEGQHAADTQQRYATKTCTKDMQYRHCWTDMRYRYATKNLPCPISPPSVYPISPLAHLQETGTHISFYKYKSTLIMIYITYTWRNMSTRACVQGCACMCGHGCLCQRVIVWFLWVCLVYSYQARTFQAPLWDGYRPSLPEERECRGGPLPEVGPSRLLDSEQSCYMETIDLGPQST